MKPKYVAAAVVALLAFFAFNLPWWKHRQKEQQLQLDECSWTATNYASLYAIRMEWEALRASQGIRLASDGRPDDLESDAHRKFVNACRAAYGADAASFLDAVIDANPRTANLEIKRFVMEHR